MSRPYVTDVTFNNGEIVLTVLLDDYLANKPVEITGYATQNSGGFAIFNDTQSVNKNPAGNVIMYVSAAPSGEFKNGEDVTVFLRAASIWITVLGEDQDDGVQPAEKGTSAQDGATWNDLKSVGYPNARAAENVAVGDDSSFPGA
jgi:hypothetical protein